MKDDTLVEMVWQEGQLSACTFFLGRILSTSLTILSMSLSLSVPFLKAWLAFTLPPT